MRAMRYLQPFLSARFASSWIKGDGLLPIYHEVPEHRQSGNYKIDVPKTPEYLSDNNKIDVIDRSGSPVGCIIPPKTEWKIVLYDDAMKSIRIEASTNTQHKRIRIILPEALLEVMSKIHFKEHNRNKIWTTDHDIALNIYSASDTFFNRDLWNLTLNNGATKYLKKVAHSTNTVGITGSHARAEIILSASSMQDIAEKYIHASHAARGNNKNLDIEQCWLPIG